jgi:hypothetical protein
MSASCCGGGSKFGTPDPGYRRALWLVLAINAAMFAVEIGAGLAAGSASLHRVGSAPDGQCTRAFPQ